MPSSLDAVAPPFAPAIVKLTAEEVAAVLALADQVTADPSSDPQGFCWKATVAARRLPSRVLDVLYAFKNAGTERGCLLFDGLPPDDVLPATPADNTVHAGEKSRLARVQAILNQAFGEQLAYEAEGGGRLFQDMVPNRAQASMQTSLGSGVELELHTEQAFSPLKPDVLSLACQRGDPGARTYTMCSHTLLDSLTPEERALARQPLWTVGVDASFKLSGQHAFLLGDVRGPIPIISGAEDDPILTFDQDLMKGTTPAAAALLARVVDVYQARRDTTVLAPGHVLLIDNVRSVHGRSPFAPRWDGADRWILRTFVVRDLVRTRYARPHGGRVCAAVHS